MPITTVVFDAYGTLFDVTAAARRAAEQPGQDKLAEVWEKLAYDWRNKQLQYSWLRAVTGDYTPFSHWRLHPVLGGHERCARLVHGSC